VPKEFQDVLNGKSPLWVKPVEIEKAPEPPATSAPKGAEK
jgi:hypothetical protein